mmetsp:Transcript_22528/g.48533  ORF Transcript_22528/g.48533 Transcript_22528/m.48533 type:complete len:200 (-) Transcript_22528:731-1330(-)
MPPPRHREGRVHLRVREDESHRVHVAHLHTPGLSQPTHPPQFPPRVRRGGLPSPPRQAGELDARRGPRPVPAVQQSRRRLLGVRGHELRGNGRGSVQAPHDVPVGRVGLGDVSGGRHDQGGDMRPDGPPLPQTRSLRRGSHHHVPGHLLRLHPRPGLRHIPRPGRRAQLLQDRNLYPGPPELRRHVHSQRSARGAGDHP